MVLFTASKYVTNWMGPKLLKLGISLRQHLPRSTSYNYDFLCGLPMAQTMMRLSLYDESSKRVAKELQQQQQQQQQQKDHNALKMAPGDPQYYQTISKIRLQVLKEYLLPALVSNTANDENTLEQEIQRWNWNIRLLKWVRQEVLIAKYGPYVKEALDAYPQLRMSPQFSRHPTHRMLLNLARGRYEWGTKTTTNSGGGNGNGNSGDDDSTANQQTTTRIAGGPSQLLLPSTETILKAFRMRKWAKTKQTLIPKATSPTGDDDSTTSALNSREKNWSMEEILDLATGGSGGPIEACGSFNTVCEEANIYQLWTQEYVQHLGDYLIRRASEGSADAGAAQTTTTGNPPTTLILDIGAGDGLLLHYLQEYYQKKRKGANTKIRGRRKVPLPSTIPSSIAVSSSLEELPSMDWIATDDGSWRIFAKAKVEKLDVHQALQKYYSKDCGHNDEEGQQQRRRRRRQQVIVLCSWMPMGHDWTQIFRDADVDEYILIGETDDGSCGHNWYTWGNAADYFPESVPGSDDNDDESSPKTLPIPPHERDGYQRWDMDALAPYQFSRFDCALSKSGKTVSFRRQ